MCYYLNVYFQGQRVKPKTAIKYLSNYPNKMRNIYSLHIFTVFLLHVSMFLVPSSERNYVPFAASQQVVFIFLSSTPSSSFWDVPLLNGVSNISCRSYYVEQCTGDVTHNYSLLILCTEFHLARRHTKFCRIFSHIQKAVTNWTRQSLSGRLCGKYFSHSFALCSKIFHLKLRRTEHCTKEFNVMRVEDRTGIVVEFEQVFPLTLYTATHHSWFTEFLDGDIDGKWLLINPNTTNFYFYYIMLCIYTFISFNHYVVILRLLKYI